MKSFFLSDIRGFTLIDAIISITIAAILGTVLIQFMGTTLASTSGTISTVQAGLMVKGTMEDITRDYRNWLREYPDDAMTVFAGNIMGLYNTGTITVTASDFEIVAGADGDVDILEVTVRGASQADAGQQPVLRAFFTKTK